MHYPKLKLISASCFAAGLLFLNPADAHAEQQLVMAQQNQLAQNEAAQGVHAQYPIETAIQNSKIIFDIDSSYDIFKSSYNTSGDQSYWDLMWSRSESDGNINIRVNSISGEILNYDRWGGLPPGEKLSGLPQYDYQAAAAFAQQWVKKLAPQYYSQTKLTEQEQPLIRPYGDREPINYHYQFVRMVDGVPYSDNIITVRIDADTGQLKSFNINWDDQANFPSKQNILDSDQAEEIFSQQVELAYHQPANKGDETANVMLVYRLKGDRAPLIDAHTGDLIAKDRFYVAEHDLMGNTEETARGDGFTEVELQEIENLKNLLSSDDALKKARSLIKIPSKMKLQETNLEENSLFKQRIWKFYLRSDGQTMNLAVDASTGELVYLYSWHNNQSKQNSKPKYNKEQAQIIAEEFIKNLQAKQSAEVSPAMSSSDVTYRNDREQVSSYSFLYERMVNDIPFSNNGFRVEVDAHTGEISYYNYLWWQPEFPEPDAIIGLDEATQTFLQDDGLDLDYYRLTNNGDKQEIRLTYHLKEQPSLKINAFTGNFIDWQGKPIAPKLTSQFTDIAGHPAEEAIRTLAQVKVAQSSDGKFYPHRNITKMEALTWMIASKNHYLLERNSDDLDKNIINEALRKGLIEKDEIDTLGAELTRLEYAKLMINYLDYTGAAKLSDIYVLKTKDAHLVPQSLRGYAAITLALGLQTEMNGNYQPSEKIPRGYAALSMLRLLNVNK